MYSQEIDKILTDNRLSFKAKGIYLIIYQGKINITLENLKQISSDGTTAIANGIKELEQLGYIKKEIVRKNGKFKKVLYKITK
jgi:hypothetical protein